MYDRNIIEQSMVEEVNLGREPCDFDRLIIFGNRPRAGRPPLPHLHTNA